MGELSNQLTPIDGKGKCRKMVLQSLRIDSMRIRK
jgi:hypothetical protein